MARFEIDPEIVSRRMGGETVLVHLRTDEMLALNETATLIFEMMAKGLDRSSIIQRVLEEFEVAASTVDREFDQLVEQLRDFEVLTATPDD